jgi:hypothetical protein
MTSLAGSALAAVVLVHGGFVDGSLPHGRSSRSRRHRSCSSAIPTAAS